MSSYDLGTLVGDGWKQWATAAGQDYYQNLSTNETQFAIPAGWEMQQPFDTWAVDGSRSWPQWRNNRTGRITRVNPSPPAPRTYLDIRGVQAAIQLVSRTPDSAEYLYRRVLVPVLRYCFKPEEDFEVIQEESRGTTEDHTGRPDVAVLKITSRPGGSLYEYDYCLIECKRAGRDWNYTTEKLGEYCEGTFNESGQVYGMVHIGLEVQFFQANSGVLTQLTGRLHIRNDVNTIMRMMRYMKANPLPFLPVR